MASVLLLMIVTVMTRTATTADDSRTLEARGNKPYLRHLVKHTNTHNVHSRSSRQSLMPSRSLPRQRCWAVRTYVCLRWSHIIKAVSFVRGAVEAPSTTLVCTARQYTHARRHDDAPPQSSSSCTTRSSRLPGNNRHNRHNSNNARTTRTPFFSETVAKAAAAAALNTCTERDGISVHERIPVHARKKARPALGTPRSQVQDCHAHAATRKHS